MYHLPEFKHSKYHEMNNNDNYINNNKLSLNNPHYVSGTVPSI